MGGLLHTGGGASARIINGLPACLREFICQKKFQRPRYSIKILTKISLNETENKKIEQKQ